MKRLLKAIYRIVFPVSLDDIFSEDGKERTALRIAARFSRGNTGVQNGKVTTDRGFAEEMKRMARRVHRGHQLSQ